MNYQAVDYGLESLVKIDVPSAWGDAEDEAAATTAVDEPDFIKNVLRPMNAQKGDTLPVSTFLNRPDGEFPLGGSKFEKRGVAINVPEWHSEHCIQCNQCSYVCPHAAIRPFLLNEGEIKNAPEGFETIKAMGKDLEGLQYRIQVSALDCTGCGSCVEVCPAKQKAITMMTAAPQIEAQKENWEYAVTVSDKSYLTNKFTVKGSQFSQPLFEFSGACAGCGEAPYIKLLPSCLGSDAHSQCYRLYFNIWRKCSGNSVLCNAEGKGPAWANSLFEDNAEYGYGMFLHQADKK